MKNKIAVRYEKNVSYPNVNEFIYPDKNYAELNIKYKKFSKHNNIFKMIRESFYMLGLDEKNYNTENWNPLGDMIIKPGDVVLIKPNMVLDKNQNGEGEQCLYTNPSLVSAVINYVWIALKKKGKIIVADAPVQSCDFKNLIKSSGYEKMINFFRNNGVNIEIKDFRGLVTHFENGEMIQEIVEENGIVVDLENESEHAKLPKKDMNKLRITNYNPDELLTHHNEKKHEYFIAKDVLEADVIINMPKPKAHRKAGVTIRIKKFRRC